MPRSSGSDAPTVRYAVGPVLRVVRKERRYVSLCVEYCKRHCMGPNKASRSHRVDLTMLGKDWDILNIQGTRGAV